MVKDDFEDFTDNMISLGDAHMYGKESGVKTANDLLSFLNAERSQFISVIPEYTFNALVSEISKIKKQIEAL